MKIFVDTNIFLDLILKRKNYQEALSIFSAIENSTFEGVILDITILNIDYIARKQTTNLKDFLMMVTHTFEVAGGSNILMEEALHINNKDLEDNLQYICAKYTNCDVIISNDKKFYRGSLEVMSSVAFVDIYLNK
jgi:predicted nucleic acid-binding protein